MARGEKCFCLSPRRSTGGTHVSFARVCRKSRLGYTRSGVSVLSPMVARQAKITNNRLRHAQLRHIFALFWLADAAPNSIRWWAVVCTGRYFPGGPEAVCPRVRAFRPGKVWLVEALRLFPNGLAISG